MKVAINESTLTAIGDAIREKTETTDLIAPGSMPAAIRSITTGGGGENDGNLVIDNQSARYMFSNNAWNKVIDELGNRIKLTNIYDTEYMFSDSHKLTNIPFDIQLSPKPDGQTIILLGNMFYNCRELERIPNITHTYDGSETVGGFGIGGMFDSCYKIKEVDMSVLPWEIAHKMSANTYFGMNSLFKHCYSLKHINGLDLMYSSVDPYSYLYHETFRYCYCLDSIENLHPLDVVTRDSASSTHYFFTTFASTQRLKRMTFATQNNGSPYVRKWHKVVIDLSSSGWGKQPGTYLDITGQKMTDLETYLEYRNQDNCWTEDMAYSRYDGNSAAETLNSLPDTSAYVSEMGSANTIKFKGDAGSGTYGGAIKNISNSTIAIAAAKGWTVSFT